MKLKASSVEVGLKQSILQIRERFVQMLVKEISVFSVFVFIQRQAAVVICSFE